METQEKTMSGGCLCGALRYTLSASPFAADYCHCQMCRKSTGAPVSAWMDFKATQVSWNDSSALQEYASAEHTIRGFCSVCGSTLSYRDVRHPEYYSLAIASLDNPELVAPTYHIYTDSQLSWFTLVDDHKRYSKGQS